MKKFLTVGVGSALLMVEQAQAAVPAAVSTAVTDMAADGASVAGLVLVAIIGIVAIKFIRKGL